MPFYVQFVTTSRLLEVEDSIDITHSYIGDLLVELVSPAGTEVTLHRRHGGSRDNIIETYIQASKPGLQSLRGEAVAGVRRLKISDLTPADKGKLNRWSLRIVKQS